LQRADETSEGLTSVRQGVDKLWAASGFTFLRELRFVQERVQVFLFVAQLHSLIRSAAEPRRKIGWPDVNRGLSLTELVMETVWGRHTS